MSDTSARARRRRLVARARRLRAAPRYVSATLAVFGSDGYTQVLALAVAIGATAGIAVVVFYKTIGAIQQLVLVSAIRTPVSDALLIPVLVAVGLTACRGLVRWGARDSPGENVPDVMYRVTVKGGVVHSVPALIKTLGAAVVIGTGGSVGAEGPVVVLGAAAASRIGRWLHASPNRLRTLVGCGAAAGISAAFNAPIAGVIFGIEKILGAASGMALGPFVVASIIAATVGRAVFGNHPVMALPAEYGVRSAWELLLYVGLGLLTGVISVLYSRGVWKAHDLFTRLRPWLQVTAGAVIVGGLDLAFRADLWGYGHESLDLGILTSRSALFLLALTFAKLIATAATFAAGGTGGVFTPALFIGATLGGACGLALQELQPAWHVTPGALSLVGMAGLVSGATHAPLTAVMMVFEMTGDYELILPLMLTSVLAYGIARRIHPESIYTEWLLRRGVVLTHGADAAILARVAVGECLNPSPVVVPEDAGLARMLELTRGGPQGDFPVVDADGRLVGMLNREAVREAVQDHGDLGAVVVAADLVTLHFDRVTTEDTLLTALRRLGDRDVNALAVVRADQPNRLEGIVTRQDVFAAYERTLTEEAH